MTTAFTLSDAVHIDVTLVEDATAAVSVAIPGSATIEPRPAQSIDVFVPGPAGPQSVFVQPTQPANMVGGLWVQTGLGPDGSGFTFWIDDGV